MGHPLPMGLAWLEEVVSGYDNVNGEADEVAKPDSLKRAGVLPLPSNLAQKPHAAHTT
jgi:hypothetical protein